MSKESTSRTRVGKYEVGRVLGEGTFAKVRLAKNLETGQQVAIKVFDKHKILKDQLTQQIKREISTMKLIKHPNVVQLYEILASKTKVYIVLEYVTGGELFNKIAYKGRLKEDEARKYVQQLINAVDYCHSRGVYHRDLKPENLLVDGNGNLKISDFGLSALPQHLREDGLLHTTCGTPNYVAPEVIVHKGYDGAKADVWSCGIILFVLLGGYLPFDDSNLLSLYKKIHKAELRFPLCFSSGARKLISMMLNPDPQLRITIPEILEDSWFKANYRPPKFAEIMDIDVEDVAAVFSGSLDCLVTEDEQRPGRPAFFNAFKLISLSKGLNLSGLFEKKEDKQHELHFTSTHPAPEIISKIEEVAKPLGFNVWRQNYKMRLHGLKAGRKGHLSIASEIFEVAPSLFVVELRKAAGDTLEYHNFYENFTKGIKDIVWKREEEAEL
ncbi:hypothetical protein GOP47_0020022 [Adiantum capillus-veneris]|uniref:non-specific serine/threonine protein kinase n=1 Tax=Adiantum capillus-veneris TaxID=13818 RepID=A0A9D4UCM8_ADICA|nr:hypothetical protein GOP47_0020022 [Adiantum capillus-veneris]